MVKKRVVIILQARMGATRLPEKPLIKVMGRPLLSYQLERLRRVKLADEVVVATTTDPKDNPIADFCRENHTACFRGSEEDVLDRYYQAAKHFHADYVVRVTGDCPLIDPKIVDQVIQCYLDHLPKYDYISNSQKDRTDPRGLDTEIFSFDMLERAVREAKLPSEREHVTVYFYTHPELFSLYHVRQSQDISHHRWTVDTAEDLDLITKILTALYPVKPDFDTQDILKILDKHPDWVKINAHIKQKPV